MDDLEARLFAEREYLSTVGEELRNPVSPLVAQLHWLIEQVAAQGEQVDRDWVLSRLRKFDCRLEKFLDTLTRVLEVPALEAGQLALHLETVDFADVVHHVLARMSAELDCARCLVHAELPETLVGMWDRQRLGQIVGNLLSNAIRFGAGHPIHVLLEGDGHEARLTIRDHGVGIALEEQSMVFERHHRISRPRIEGGFGVGLWLTRELVTALGGRIELSSTPGEGAAFRVTLPRTHTAGGEA